MSELSDEQVQRYAEEAEAGYDPDQLKPRPDREMTETEHVMHFIMGFCLAEPPDQKLLHRGIIPALSEDQLLTVYYRLDALQTRIREVLGERINGPEVAESPPAPTLLRNVSIRDSLRIGRAIGDIYVIAGYRLACNGGNPDLNTHHDSEVLLKFNEFDNLQCPQCGRVQQLPAGWREQ